MEIISNKITIKRKEVTTSFVVTNKESMEEGFHKIGASIRNNDVCRGLTSPEEKALLPDLLGIQPDDRDYQKTVKEYWNCISKQVPQMGLELEVGFKYETAEKAAQGQKANEEDKYKFGTPINVVDYVLYRYCLVYADVANKEEDKHKSNRIRFYIFSKEQEIKTNVAKLTLSNEAYGKYLQVLGNRDKVEDILRLMTNEQGISLYQVGFASEELDVILQGAMLKNPTRFIALYDDKVLEMKSFISRCISGQYLTRVANTDTIMFGNNTIIGNTMEEAVAYLKNDKNAQTLNTLQIQVGVVKAKPSTIDKIENPKMPIKA